MTREAMSRPNPSVPIRWAAFGGWRRSTMCMTSGPSGARVAASAATTSSGRQIARPTMSSLEASTRPSQIGLRLGNNGTTSFPFSRALARRAGGVRAMTRLLRDPGLVEAHLGIDRHQVVAECVEALDVVAPGVHDRQVGRIQGRPDLLDSLLDDRLVNRLSLGHVGLVAALLEQLFDLFAVVTADVRVR